MPIVEIEEQLREFLTNNFIFDQAFQLGPDDSLMENSIVDSTGVLELIMWLETNFGISVEDSEVLPDNLDSVRFLTSYIHRKLQPTLAAAS
jgi:acyl carrier protein